MAAPENIVWRSSISMKRKPLPDISGREAEALAKLRRYSVVNENGCWVWQRFKNRWDYGWTVFRNTQIATHRLAYLASRGPFDPTLDVCHSCDNPTCCNPDHLWLGTHVENMADSIAKKRHFYRNQKNCNRGHPLSGDNLYVAPDGVRNCRICNRAGMRIRAGWPEDLAYSMPPTSPGRRPVGGKFKRRASRSAPGALP